MPKGEFSKKELEDEEFRKGKEFMANLIRELRKIYPEEKVKEIVKKVIEASIKSYITGTPLDYSHIKELFPLGEKLAKWLKKQ
jgi:hypothetical protein